MKIFKTLRSHQPSFSTDNSLNLTAPKSWKDLTQEQLHYVLFLLSAFEDHTVIKTYMFVRFTGIHVISKDRFGWKCFVRVNWGRRKFFTIQAWQIESLLGQMSYIDSYEGMGVRLEDIHGLHAVNIDLHGVSFIDYLNLEKYYQGYLMEKKDKYIELMGTVLYRKRVREKALLKNKYADRVRTIKMDNAEYLSVLMWYSYVKLVFAKAFIHFFKRLDSDDMDSFDMIKAMNVQIRALTNGDVTKEQTIYNIDCWRALTELDQKACEAEEYEKMKAHGK